jgi:hypothetical protein
MKMKNTCQTMRMNNGDDEDGHNSEDDEGDYQHEDESVFFDVAVDDLTARF